MLRANCKFIVGGKKAWSPRLKGAVFYYITAAVSRAVFEALKKRFICVSISQFRTKLNYIRYFSN